MLSTTSSFRYDPYSTRIFREDPTASLSRMEEEGSSILTGESHRIVRTAAGVFGNQNGRTLRAPYGPQTHSLRNQNLNEALEFSRRLAQQSGEIQFRVDGIIENVCTQNKRDLKGQVFQGCVDLYHTNKDVLENLPVGSLSSSENLEQDWLNFTKSIARALSVCSVTHSNHFVAGRIFKEIFQYAEQHPQTILNANVIISMAHLTSVNDPIFLSTARWYAEHLRKREEAIDNQSIMPLPKDAIRVFRYKTIQFISKSHLRENPSVEDVLQDLKTRFYRPDPQKLAHPR